MQNALTSACFSILFFATSAFAAQNSTIQGSASDTNGKPLKNAEVRIENEKTKNAIIQTVKTDGKGHFVAAGLAPGSYTVSVVSNGTVKWSAAHVKIRSGQVVHLNLSRHPAVSVAAANSQPKKRAVWVPESVGSHLGGHWEDQPTRGAGADNVDTMSTHQLDQFQRTAVPSYPGVSGGGGR